MKFKKKTIFLAMAALLAVVIVLPATREQFAWYWVETQDQATGYMQFYTNWPNGLHAIEARVRYENRLLKETTMALISDAVKRNSEGKPDPEALKERRTLQEHFLWKHVTNDNTVFGYQDYLRRYPTGEFADQAHRLLDDLTRKTGSGTGSTN